MLSISSQVSVSRFVQQFSLVVRLVMENFLNNGKVESFLLAENAAHLLESDGEGQDRKCGPGSKSVIRSKHVSVVR